MARRALRRAAPALLALAASTAFAGLPVGPPEARVVRAAASGSFLPGGTLRITATASSGAPGLEIRWPRGLTPTGPVIAAGRAEPAVFEARVTGPVHPETPVEVRAHRGGEIVDAVSLPILVGIHEGGVGPPEGFFPRWLELPSLGLSLPLPKVSDGVPARLLAELPRDPEGRIRTLLRAGATQLAEGSIREGSLTLRRAGRLVRLVQSRGRELPGDLGFRVVYCEAVARAASGDLTGAREALESVPTPPDLARYALLLEGAVALGAGDGEGARGAFSRALARAPHLHAARRLLAE